MAAVAIVDPPRDAVSGSCSGRSVAAQCTEGLIGWSRGEGGGQPHCGCGAAQDQGLDMKVGSA